MDDRGQTLWDYTFGISIFLLTIITVFVVVPSIFTPFNAPVGSEKTVQANRLSGELVTNLSEDGSSNALNTSRTDDFFNDSDARDLRDRYGLGPAANLNVTLLVERSAGVTVSRQMGEPYGENAVGSALRVVTGYNGTAGDCDPTCRLIVRVW